MGVAIVSGSGGLVGSACVEHFTAAGLEVVGLENDMRAELFGSAASTRPVTRELTERNPGFRSVDVDVRDAAAVDGAFAERGTGIELVVHAAAQPSHDWAAKAPRVDFEVNAAGTLNLLEATRVHSPGATFVFCSTNKVYGDRPNDLPLEERETRLDLPEAHPLYEGIDESMAIDASMHSLFGASKLGADVLVQEYGRYFGMATACFRAGCLTGANHAGAEEHGFLAYLMRCVEEGRPYTVFGHAGKQVRDNLDARDLARCFSEFHRSPRPAAIYNIGGGRATSCSVLEAIALCEEISGRELDWTLAGEARRGDHRWWITDTSAFRGDHPGWEQRHDLRGILADMHERHVTRGATA